jgi:hypothetical protein
VVLSTLRLFVWLTPEAMPPSSALPTACCCSSLASGTKWKRVVTQSAVTRLIVHGVIDRDAAGRLELTHKAVQCSTRCSVVTRRRRDHPGFGQSTVTTLTVRLVMTVIMSPSYGRGEGRRAGLPLQAIAGRNVQPRCPADP